MKPSPQQDQALKAVSTWLKDPGAKQTFYLAGYAGTGKTTLARRLAEDIGRVCFGAFTGKAALVLRSKGCEDASTLHSLIYKIDNPNSPIPRFVKNYDSAVRYSDLVIVDEVSMVGEELGRDLLSFGTRVLVLGDPAQLPPVKGEGFFTAGDPDFMLTEVHRQAADNSIIAMSMKVRQRESLDFGAFGDSRVIRREELETDNVLAADQILVGKNSTRRNFNQRLRELKGMKGDFMVNDRVVCLKNNREMGLLNGGIWNVDKVLRQSRDTTTMYVSPLDSGMTKQPVEVITHHAWTRGQERDLHWKDARRFQPFDYAYALTCHKSQGSQWDNVMVFDEGGIFPEPERWLYTAITRAAEKVTVVQ